MKKEDYELLDNAISNNISLLEKNDPFFVYQHFIFRKC